MLICTVLALILQNGSYSTAYRHWLDMSAGVSFGSFTLEKPLLLWINDGLITIFFFSIGLELKIEFIKGHLSNIRNIILPSFAAVGGIIVPSLVFILFNFGDDFAMNGWAIPTATDTAFSVALILLLGYRVPASLKIFLLSMAIFDDIGAILVIALFYTSALSIPALIGAACAICGLAFLNYLRVGRSLLYFIVGILLWFSILKSGVHATLAGIVTAFFIPMRDERGHNMVEEMFEDLKVWVAMVVLPIFTIANAGVDLSTISIKDFFSPVSLGIFFGLVVGKQLGIFGVVWLCVKTKLVQMPEDANMRQVYGVCILTGIGFSMSMFIDSLAYQGSNIFNYADSLAILLASLVSGIYGFIFLRFYACKTLGIEYRPWLPSPEGYRGDATTANLFALEPKIGPSSVAPTAALVAAANARVAAANAAVAAANKAAAAAAEVAEAMQEVVSNKDDAESVAKVQAAVAAAAAAAADAAITSTHLDESEEHEDSLEVVHSAADAAQQAAVAALEVAEAAKEEAKAAKAAAKAEEESRSSESDDTESNDVDDAQEHADSHKEKKAKSKQEHDNEDESVQHEGSVEDEKDSDDDKGLPTRIIKTVANVAKDTASIVADVATSILSKDDEDEDDESDKDKPKSKSKKDKEKTADASEQETIEPTEAKGEPTEAKSNAQLKSVEGEQGTLDEATTAPESEDTADTAYQNKTTQDKDHAQSSSLAEGDRFETAAADIARDSVSSTQAHQDQPLDAVALEAESLSKIERDETDSNSESDNALNAEQDIKNKLADTTLQESESQESDIQETDAQECDTQDGSDKSKDRALLDKSEQDKTSQEKVESESETTVIVIDDDDSEEDGDLEADVIPLDAVYQAALESRGIITDRETAVMITKLQHSVAQSAQQIEVSALSKKERQETAEIAASQEPNEDVSLAIKAQVNTLLTSEGKIEYIENIEHIETAVKQLLDLNAAVAKSTAKKTLDSKHAQRLDLNFRENQAPDKETAKQQTEALESQVEAELGVTETTAKATVESESKLDSESEVKSIEDKP